MSQLVAALIREYRQARDKAIFDAYQNGGLFEGKPVTDQALLDYIQQRRDMFTKDDPLWDQWNNTYIQQKFTIDESKVGLTYKESVAAAAAAQTSAVEAASAAYSKALAAATTAQARAAAANAYNAAIADASNAYSGTLATAAGLVAAFYTGQLSSIPKDSAFYREVAGKAAEWQKAASEAEKAATATASELNAGGGGGGGGGGGASAAKDKVAIDDMLQAAKVQAFYADQAIRAALLREGYQISDKQSVMAVGADVIQQLFDSGAVGFTMDTWTKVEIQLRDILTQAIPIYQAAHADYLGLVQQRATLVQDTIVKIDSLDEMVRAESIYQTLDQALSDANGDRSLIAKAYADAKTQIDGLLQSATANGADTDLIAALRNDSTALGGGTPNGFGLIDIINAANEQSGQHVFEYATIDKASGAQTQAQQISIDIAQVQTEQKLLASGAGYYQQDPKTGVLTVQDKSVQPIESLPQNFQPTLILSGGQLVTALLAGQAVYSQQTVVGKDANGQPIIINDPRLLAAGEGTQQGDAIGYIFKYTIDGKTVTAYAVRNADHTLTFTSTDPFLGKMADSGKGYFTMSLIGPDGTPTTVEQLILHRADGTIPGASTTLVIDPRVTDVLRSDPVKAAALVDQGTLTIDAFANAVTGSTDFLSKNPTATPLDVAAAAKTLQALGGLGGYGTAKALPQAPQATATSLLAQRQYPQNLLQQRIYDNLGLVAQNIINPLTPAASVTEAPPIMDHFQTESFAPTVSPTLSPTLVGGTVISQPTTTTGTLVGGTVIYPTATPTAPAPAPTTSGTLVGGTVIYPSTDTSGLISISPTTTKTYQGGYTAI